MSIYIVKTEEIYNKAKRKVMELDIGDLAVFGSLEGFISIIITSIISYLSKPFTIFNFWVSNLGATKSGYYFNIGLFISAILLFIYMISVNYKFWNFLKTKKLLMVLTNVSGLISSIGIILLTTNDMFSSPKLHGIGAYMFFLSSLIFVLLFTYILKITYGVSHNIIRLAILFTIFYIGIGVSIIVASTQVDGNVIANMLSSMDPTFFMVRFFEWLIVLSFLYWIFSSGLEIRKYKT